MAVRIYTKGGDKGKTSIHGDFPDYQVKSLEAVGRMVERNGGKYVTSLGDIIEILNTCK